MNPLKWLAHPLTRGLSIDDPGTTSIRRRIIREKLCLRQIYEEWYIAIARAIPPGERPVVELGSGAGFLSDFIPGLIASEVFCCQGINVVLDGQQLPFASGTLRAIVMTDVLHHLPKVRRFFREASRCLQVGGTIVMIEPWVTAWSHLVYGRLHHELFLPQAAQWEFPAAGPLSGANGALPWIVFQRDRRLFEHEFPQLRIVSIKRFMPFRYLVSGGVSLRDLTPGWTLGFWRRLESGLEPLNDYLSMFAQVVLARVE